MRCKATLLLFLSLSLFRILSPPSSQFLESVVGVLLSSLSRPLLANVLPPLPLRLSEESGGNSSPAAAAAALSCLSISASCTHFPSCTEAGKIYFYSTKVIFVNFSSCNPKWAQQLLLSWRSSMRHDNNNNTLLLLSCWIIMLSLFLNQIMTDPAGVNESLRSSWRACQITFFFVCVWLKILFGERESESEGRQADSSSSSFPVSLLIFSRCGHSAEKNKCWAQWSWP